MMKKALVLALAGALGLSAQGALTASPNALPDSAIFGSALARYRDSLGGGPQRISDRAILGSPAARDRESLGGGPHGVPLRDIDGSVLARDRAVLGTPATTEPAQAASSHHFAWPDALGVGVAAALLTVAGGIALARRHPGRAAIHP